jgi:hypothetical protein
MGRLLRLQARHKAIFHERLFAIMLMTYEAKLHSQAGALDVLSALLPQTMLLADRGYDANRIRELARQQGAWANIPPKRNRKDPK